MTCSCDEYADAESYHRDQKRDKCQSLAHKCSLPEVEDVRDQQPSHCHWIVVWSTWWRWDGWHFSSWSRGGKPNWELVSHSNVNHRATRLTNRKRPLFITTVSFASSRRKKVPDPRITSTTNYMSTVQLGVVWRKLWERVSRINQ